MSIESLQKSMAVLKENSYLIRREIEEHERVIEIIKQKIEKEGRFVHMRDGKVVDLEENIRWRVEKLKDYRELFNKISNWGPEITGS